MLTARLAFEYLRRFKWLPHMPKHASKRSRRWWRRTLQIATIAFAVASLAVIAALYAVQKRDAGLDVHQPPSVAAPSRSNLDRSISLAEHYLDGLYKPLPDGGAVQSEAYGLPLRAYFPAQRKWVLLGEGDNGACTLKCNAVTAISPTNGTPTTEGYEVRFKAKPKEIRLHAFVQWQAAPHAFTVTLSPDKVTTTVQIWLDTVHFATFHAGDKIGRSRTFADTQVRVLRTLRYTVRHATQESYLYWLLRGDRKKTSALRSFFTSNGYTAGLDMRAAMFGLSKTLPDDLPFNLAAYPDCGHLPAANPLAYPYKSKACLSMETYLKAGARDSFLQASLALHTLQKYGPNYHYPLSHQTLSWLEGTSPAEASQNLQKQWWITSGIGLPKCTPLSCSQLPASGIRTYVFGLLEARLGYQFGDPTAKRYADAAAALTVAGQIGRGGAVRMKQATLIRPAQAGAFPVSWDDASGRFAPPDDMSLLGGALMLGIGNLSMPAEYVGVQPSNSETSFDAWAFLVQYRCLRYGVGCQALKQLPQ